MTTASPPRPGRWLAGSNTLETWWTWLALALLTLAGLACLIGWTALAIEGALAGTAAPVRLADMPTVLARLATGSPPQSVARPWLATGIAAVLTAGVGAFGTTGLRRWWRWRDGWRHRRMQHERHTSPAWATRRDLAGLTAPPPPPGQPEPAPDGRLYLGSIRGRDLLAPPRTSVMVVAPTRTGKSTRLVVPNLLRWDGPAVVTSVKRDVYDLTAVRRAAIGPTVLFDPTGTTGLDSVKWSPLLTATTFPDATRTATWLADAAAVQERHDNAKFWETLATKLLAPLLFAAANTGHTMIDVSHWVDRSAFDDVELLLLQLGDDDAHAAWEAIRDLPHETRGSVLGTAMAIFRAFGSPRVRQATSATPDQLDDTDVLDIEHTLAHNGTIYLVSPEYEQSELRPVFVALVQAIYRAAVSLSATLLDGAPLNPPLLMMLDEAGNIAPLQTLPKIASTGAGQGITLMTIWQDRAQIRAIYGDNDRTVIANHTSTVWLPGTQDLDTLRLLSDLIGDQWVASTNLSTSPDGGLSISEGSERIDVAPPAFLRTLPHGKAIVLTGNLPPALADSHAYYQQVRWDRHIPRKVLDQYSAMHTDAGPTTKHRWAQQAEPLDQQAPRNKPAGRGMLALALAADWPTIPCNRHARHSWDLDAIVPDTLTSAPGHWHTIPLPASLADRIDGRTTADLTSATTRRHILRLWLQHGPADQLADTITFPQLRTEWPQLPLPDPVRQAWEDCYPGLTADLDLFATHNIPSAGRDGIYELW